MVSAVRYSPINQALHWLTAAGMFTILPLGWVMTSMPLDAPRRADLFAWHETLGLFVLLVTAIRIAWRWLDGPPPYTARVARWERGLARVVHWLFFLILLWMPVTGYLTASYGGHGIRLFDSVLAPDLLAPSKSTQALFDWLHKFGQWLVYTLLFLHLGGVAFHLIWAKTGVLGRMLPAYATTPEE